MRGAILLALVACGHDDKPLVYADYPGRLVPALQAADIPTRVRP